MVCTSMFYVCEVAVESIGFLPLANHGCNFSRWFPHWGLHPESLQVHPAHAAGAPCLALVALFKIAEGQMKLSFKQVTVETTTHIFFALWFLRLAFFFAFHLPASRMPGSGEIDFLQKRFRSLSGQVLLYDFPEFLSDYHMAFCQLSQWAGIPDMSIYNEQKRGRLKQFPHCSHGFTPFFLFYWSIVYSLQRPRWDPSLDVINMTTIWMYDIYIFSHIITGLQHRPCTFFWDIPHSARCLFAWRFLKTSGKNENQTKHIDEQRAFWGDAIPWQCVQFRFSAA